RAGVVDVLDPLPSPLDWDPQQYPVPDVVTPHVCSPSAEIEANASPPATATGPAWLLVVPSPSCPTEFNPQQYAAPVVRTPQVCSSPALMVLNVSDPNTPVGTDLCDVLPLVPSPSVPKKLAPQQYAVPATDTPHMCELPTSSLAHLIPPPTSTGAVLD